MESQAMTIRLPGDLYEQLRKQAYETRVPMNQIVVAALRAAANIIEADQAGTQVKEER